MSHFITINEGSVVPKRTQIVNSLIKKIESNSLEVGDKLPSINELSSTCYISRDTVERAYRKMKDQNIIQAVKGKGYFVAKNHLNTRINILFLVNKSSPYKMMVYNSFVRVLGTKAQVHLAIYHCEESLFIRELENRLESYNHYIILPHFKDDFSHHVNFTPRILKYIERIPSERLMLLDNSKFINDKITRSVYQDYEDDVYNALMEGKKKFIKYEKLILVFPENTAYPYPKKIRSGFLKFCTIHDFDFKILGELYEDMDFQRKDLFITILETDLVNLARQLKARKLEMGVDIGVISYNDTPLKELLGINVISTDFKTMGETAAYMVLKNKKEHVKNAFKYIERNSV